MTKIIGHRGAKGIALENSRASFLAAVKHGVDIIELDVHLTVDDKLVVLHDPDTARVAESKAKVNRKTLQEIKQIRLKNDEEFLSLDEALDIIGNNVPVYIELKALNSTDELLLVLGRHPNLKASVVSYFAPELKAIKRVVPDMDIYLSEHFDPIGVINKARSIHARGIQLNKWLMNPLTYKLAERYSLVINLYTVNNPLMGKILHRLYPNVNFYTNHPERFIDVDSKARLIKHT